MLHTLRNDNNAEANGIHHCFYLSYTCSANRKIFEARPPRGYCYCLRLHRRYRHHIFSTIIAAFKAITLIPSLRLSFRSLSSPCVYTVGLPNSYATFGHGAWHQNLGSSFARRDAVLDVQCRTSQLCRRRGPRPCLSLRLPMEIIFCGERLTWSYAIPRSV